MVTVADEMEQSLPDDDSTPSAYKCVEEAAAQWVATGGHLHQGLNIQAVADEMHLPRPLLTAWLKTTEWELFDT